MQPTYKVGLIDKHGALIDNVLVRAPTGHDAIIKVHKQLEKARRDDVKGLTADAVH